MIAPSAAPSSRNRRSVVEVAPDVAYLTTVFVNVYLVGDAHAWILVDSGLPGSALLARHAAAERFGEASRPEAIVLTHGHFDHAGSALELAEAWDAPIYAHRLEVPYLTGASDYPPKDSSMGGAMAQMARTFPTSGLDLRPHVMPLPEDGRVPGLPTWRWLHTPGHTAGHVSLYREADRTLLAGDALSTMDLDSWTSQLTEAPELSRPPVPLTTDWQAARDSVERLADLDPDVVAAGHGRPMEDVGEAALRSFVARMEPPREGRYASRPARADETGVVDVSPPVHDPYPRRFAFAAAAFALGGLLLRRRRRRAG